MSDFVGNGSSCICFGGSEGLWAPLEQKLRGTKEWDGDMVAWIIAGIRVLFLDTKNYVYVYMLESSKVFKFESCYFHAIYLVCVNQFMSRNWNSMDYYQCTIIVWLVVICASGKSNIFSFLFDFPKKIEMEEKCLNEELCIVDGTKELVSVIF